MGIAQRVELPDGTEVWARLSTLDPQDEEYGSYEDVGALSGVVAKVHDLRRLITGVAASVHSAAAAAGPDEVSVAFGVELAVRGGGIVSMLAEGEATTSIAVTLTWRRPEPGGRTAEVPAERTAVPAPSAGADG